MIELLLMGLLLWFLVTGLLAPLESLGWWAGWFGEDVLDEAKEEAVLIESREPSEAAEQYVVYLSGIGAFAGTSIVREEVPFLDALEGRLANGKIVRDVFPYSVTNLGLSSERFFSWLWKWIEAQRPKNPQSYWLFLVVYRNLFQVAVSADQRYGPIYNLGIAKEVWRGLLRQGYQPGSGTPVVLIGTSGGGQISVGCVPYLARIIEAPILVISIGGVISADPGLLAADHLYHLYGSQDGTQRLGYKLFPGRWRWPFSRNSPWYQAERAGKLTLQEIGPFVHTGKNSAFDQGTSLPDGQRNFDVTLARVSEIIQQWYAKHTSTNKQQAIEAE